MKYTYHPEGCIKQLNAYNELEAMEFSPEDSREYVISRLEERSAKMRVIANVANTIIKEYVETFEKNPAAITDEDAGALKTFSFLLYPNRARAENVRVSDFGIFYRIEKILTGYYRRQGDQNNYIISLNRCSLAHLLLISAHSLKFKDSPIREDCLALIGLLDTGNLNEDVKINLLSAISRETIHGEDCFPAAEYKSTLDMLLSHMTHPLSDHDRMVLSFYCLALLSMFYEHNIYAKERGLTVDAENVRPLIHEVRDVLSEQSRRNPNIDPDIDLPIDYLITDFCLGDISLDELLEGLSALRKKALEQTDPLEKAYQLGICSSYYLDLLYRFSPLPKAEIFRMGRELIRDVMSELVKISRMVNNVFFNRSIVDFLTSASLVGTFDEFAEVILESTVYADKPLYIHTEMVQEMSRVIFDYMIEATPEVFDGVAGHTAAYIREHKDEMKKLLDDCCMFHDIGKFYILDIVENSMRRLTDDEFGLIKEHPGHFEHIYQIIEDRDERVLCIRDCAVTHHLWHDGTRGYPNVPQTKNRPFADILAIADCIDAATDFLGRPYTSGKTIDQLIAEFQAEAGTRYGPEAAAALSVPEVRDKLNYWITEGRKEIYYRIYAFNKI